VDASDRALWWSLWWPWMVIWGVTALALVVLAVTAVLAWRARDQYGLEGLPLGVPVYIDGLLVLNIMSVLGLKPIPTDVTVKAVLTRDGKINVEMAGLAAGAGASRVEEETRAYREIYKPIDLVGPLVKTLSDRNQLVYVDVVGGTLQQNVAVERHLRSTGQNPNAVSLLDIKEYVSVVGRFRLDSKGDRVKVLIAPFGEDDADKAPRVRLECADEWLLNDAVPKGTFHASCLGRVQSWKPEDQELVILPIAMFQ
jgi:hypothetical protein